MAVGTGAVRQSGNGRDRLDAVGSLMARKVRQSRRGTVGSGVDGFGRKCAEDWTGNNWHGKLGFGSTGGER